METQETTPKLTKAQKAYRKWYKANKAKFNAERNAKYANDPKLRALVIERQRKYRKTAVRVPADGHHYRVVNKKKVEVFRIGTVAEMIGREEQSIRTWERIGRIPRPTIQGAHRYYTTKQVKLLREMAELMNLVRYDPQIRALALKNKTEELNALWAGV